MSAIHTDAVERSDSDMKFCKLWALFLKSIGKEVKVSLVPAIKVEIYHILLELNPQLSKKRKKTWYPVVMFSSKLSVQLALQQKNVKNTRDSVSLYATWKKSNSTQVLFSLKRGKI